MEDASFLFLTGVRYDLWVRITNMYIRKTKYKTTFARVRTRRLPCDRYPNDCVMETAQLIGDDEVTHRAEGFTVRVI